MRFSEEIVINIQTKEFSLNFQTHIFLARRFSYTARLTINQCFVYFLTNSMDFVPVRNKEELYTMHGTDLRLVFDKVTRRILVGGLRCLRKKST